MRTWQAEISVLIPLYNKASHISDTIDSVLQQTYPAKEIIVIDDGSTDGGAELIEQKYGNSVKLIRQKNAGVSAARNRGMASASYDYVAFLDADDTWEPHFLAEIRLLVANFPEASVYTTAYQLVFDKTGFVDPRIRWPKQPLAPLLLDNYFAVGALGSLPFVMSCFCGKRAFLQRLGGFPEGEPMGEDQELFCQAALHGRIAYSPKVLSFYHQCSENRACISNLPDKECPFSQRLFALASSMADSEPLKQAIMDYTAAHILYIASLNIRAERYTVASKLLRDSRSKRHYKRYLWWKLRLAAGAAQSRARYLFAVPTKHTHTS